MAGRPTRLTKEVQDKLLQAIACGNTRRTAAAYAGVSLTALEEWIGRGKGTVNRPSRKVFAEFADALEKAEATAIVASVALIRKAGQESWTAAAWWLERRYPDDWGRKDRQELSGEVTFGDALGRVANAVEAARRAERTESSP